MWDHAPVHNLITMQQIAAIASIDRQIAEDWRGGYDVDALLERRVSLMEHLRRQQAATDTRGAQGSR